MLAVCLLPSLVFVTATEFHHKVQFWQTANVLVLKQMQRYLSRSKNILESKQATVPHLPLRPSEELNDLSCNIMNAVGIYMNGCYTQNLGTCLTHRCNHLHVTYTKY